MESIDQISLNLKKKLDIFSYTFKSDFLTNLN